MTDTAARPTTSPPSESPPDPPSDSPAESRPPQHEARGPWAELARTNWFDVAKRVKTEIKSDHATLTAGGVAFFAFLAIIPLLAATMSLYGLVADPTAVTDLIRRLGDGVPESVRALLDEQLRTIVAANAGALGLGLVIGLVSGLWSASSGFGKLIEGLNIVYDTDDDPRPFWRRRLLALGFTLGAVGLIGLSAAIVATASRLESSWRGVGLLAAWLVVAALFGSVLAVFYRYGPHREDPKWVWVSPGSVFAIVAWTAASAAFAWYVSSFGSYNETYGSLGAVVIALLWLYITSLIVVIGGELNAEAERDAR